MRLKKGTSIEYMYTFTISTQGQDLDIVNEQNYEIWESDMNYFSDFSITKAWINT